MANRVTKGKQQTVRFHVDDLLSSHVDPQVNDEFDKWLNKFYGSYGAVECHRGKIHDYLGMFLDYSEPGVFTVDMTKYIGKMVDDFPIKYKPGQKAPSPATDDLFKESTGDVLNDKDTELFHTFVAKGLFAAKRARPDIISSLPFLLRR